MKRREKAALAPKWNHMRTDLPPFVWILRLHCCYRDFCSSLCMSSRCCNKLDIIWVPTLWFSFSYLECMSNIVHGNLAREAAVLRPAFNTHAKQWHLYNWYKLVHGSKCLHLSSSTHVRWVSLFSACFGFPWPKVLTWSSVSSTCLLSFTTFMESEEKVPISPVLHNSHE